MKRRAVIFANGELKKPQELMRYLKPDDFLVAADGGVNHILRLHLQPNLVIGDLDSVTASERTVLERQKAEISQFPCDKDETDLELALQEVISRGFNTIMIAAGLGGRLDQTLGNIFLLLQPQYEKHDIRFEDGKQEVILIRDACEIHGNPGDSVSLLPLLGPVEGIVTEGLKFTLDNETLYPYKTRGISNEIKNTLSKVSIKHGFLLCVHSRKMEEKTNQF
ncbi:MAG TPA: thiamine diphosphokinase [Anaerolineae bacterium]|nr:thiamine diphosphokinase [Anaerolineae bacterium]